MLLSPTLMMMMMIGGGGCSSRFNYILIHCHSASAVCSTVVDLQHLFFPFKKIVKNRTEMVSNFDVPLKSMLLI